MARAAAVSPRWSASLPSQKRAPMRCGAPAVTSDWYSAAALSRRPRRAASKASRNRATEERGSTGYRAISSPNQRAAPAASPRSPRMSPIKYKAVGGAGGGAPAAAAPGGAGAGGGALGLGGRGGGGALLPRREREPRLVERFPRLGERAQGRGRVTRADQRLGARGGDRARGGPRHIGEQPARERGIANHPRQADAEPGVDRGYSGGARGGERRGGAVPLIRRLPGGPGAHREQRRPPTPCVRPRGAVMRGRLGKSAEPELRFGQHRQRLPIAVVVEPWLSREQALRTVVAARVQFGLRALDHERGVRSRLARRGGEQALRRMPRAARRALGLRPLAHRVHLLGFGQPGSCGQEEAPGGSPAHYDRRTRASTR